MHRHNAVLTNRFEDMNGNLHKISDKNSQKFLNIKITGIIYLVKCWKHIKNNLKKKYIIPIFTGGFHGFSKMLEIRTLKTK